MVVTVTLLVEGSTAGKKDVPKMHFRLKTFLVIIGVLQCVSLSFLLLGVTGGFDGDGEEYDEGNSRSKTAKEKHDNDSFSTGESESLLGEQIPDKIVLLVIDALRLDFLTEENFPFLLGTLAKYQSTSVLKFDVKVDSPTVTLPRVKTLVTGKAPVYMDVLKNFQTSDSIKGNTGFKQPNLISSLRKELPDASICFFGDETWLRLFPAEDDNYSPYFKKWEGVTSFYVKDFYEVDNNVTRHLEDIDECNFLILHYLGLDHIGHVYGPKQTDLLKRKLVEMDRVIQHVHSHLSNMKTKKSKNLLMITGDHGMANVGGHGGSSYEEVFTPLIGVVVGGIPQHRSKLETMQINQIDIAPTLAAIWNIGIPQMSRGRLILDLMEHFKTPDQLANSYQKNCKHLLAILGNNRKAVTYKLWWTEISKMEKPLAIKKYIELEHELSSTLQSSTVTKTDLLCSFVISMVILICMEIYLYSQLKKILGRHARLALVFVLAPPTLIYFSSSFIEEEHYIRYYLYPLVLLTSVLWYSGCKFENLLLVLKIMLLHRLAMILNQTGDKWSHLPDLNDYIQERNLQWLSAAIAVILIFVYSDKTVKCSRSFKATLLCVYASKIVTTYLDEASRSQFHWLLMDSKIQKLAFVFIFFHLTHHLYKGNIYHSISSSLLMFLLSLQRCQNLIVLGIVFVQVNLLDVIINQSVEDATRQDKSNKSSTRMKSLLCRIIVIWFAHASFYYQGNSNGLATVDVHAGYVGVESYSSSFLIGSLIFLHTYSSSLMTYMCTAKLYSPQSSVMNGHVPTHNNGKSKSRSKDKSTKSFEFLPILILLSNGAESIIYSITVMIFQNHLFIWSVFVPKLLYLITQSVVCAIVCTIYAFVL